MKRTEQVRLPVTRAAHAVGLALPRYMTEGSAGMDLLAATEGEETILPGKRALLPTGIHVAVPTGFELQVRPRSGLAIKHGIGLLNAPGTIDSDYRGEIKVILVNLGSEPYTVRRGDRIAQMVLCPVAIARLEEVDKLPQTRRDDGGFGHTGI